MRYIKRNNPILQRNSRFTGGVCRSPAGVVSLGRPANSSRPSIPLSRQVSTHSSVQQPRTQGRVFVLTPQDARALVEGMISLSGYTAHALFDPGAFTYKLNQSSESLGGFS